MKLFGCLQNQRVWRRSRHYVLPKPHVLFDKATAEDKRLSFTLRSAACQLAYLWHYQLWNSTLLSLGTLLELTAAVCVACAGDADPCLPVALKELTVPSMCELPSEEPMAQVAGHCTLTSRTGQLVTTCTKAGRQLQCFEAHLLGNMRSNTSSSTHLHKRPRPLVSSVCMAVHICDMPVCGFMYLPVSLPNRRPSCQGSVPVQAA